MDTCWKSEWSCMARFEPMTIYFSPHSCHCDTLPSNQDRGDLQLCYCSILWYLYSTVLALLLWLSKAQTYHCVTWQLFRINLRSGTNVLPRSKVKKGLCFLCRWFFADGNLRIACISVINLHVVWQMLSLTKSLFSKKYWIFSIHRDGKIVEECSLLLPWVMVKSLVPKWPIFWLLWHKQLIYNYIQRQEQKLTNS